MYTKNETPAVSATANMSYISLQLHSGGRADAVIYHASQRNEIGYYDSTKDETYLCCTAQLAQQLSTNEKEKDLCNEKKVGKIIAPNHPLVALYTLRGTQNRKFEPPQSGIYYVEITSCKCDISNTSNSSMVQIAGVVEWMNPYGYLSADLYPYLPFFAVLAFNYLLLGSFWFVLTILHFEEILMLQYFIGGIIFLGICESFMWFFDYWSENHTGLYLIIPTIIGLLSETLKITVSRVLLLSVSMGYGVIKPTLGTDGVKVVFVGVSFFIFSGSDLVYEQLEKRVHYHSSAKYVMCHVCDVMCDV